MVQTKNTLRFVGPIKIGAKEKVKAKIESDPKNPATWSHEDLVEHVQKFSKGKVDTDLFCPYESGKQIMSIPQSDFMQRLLDQKFSGLQAEKLYEHLWKLLVDSRAKLMKQTKKNI